MELTTVGRFEVVREIARGGFGIVYEVRDPQSGERAAVKVIHPDLAEDEVAVRRFDQEIRLVNLIQHPNIVPLIDVGSLEDNRPYFAMELLVGETLEARVKRQGRLGLAETVEILTPLCDALGVAHQKGIIHRDIKPSNVFLADRVVLLDFGIAKLVEQTGEKITSSRFLVGTPQTMAPEQLGGGEIDDRTDVYALGALAFFMLTATLPFSSANPAAVAERKLNAPPPRPSALVPVPETVDAAISMAMAPEPSDRPESPSAFLAALSQARRSVAHSREVTAVFIEVTAPGDDTLDEADDELVRLIDGAVALGFELVLEVANTALLFGGDGARLAVESMAELLAEPSAARRSIFATEGSADQLTSFGWVPADRRDGAFIVGTKNA